MPCKYLSGGRIACCLASDQLMVPSLFELTIFCNQRYQECLIYQEKEGIVGAREPAITSPSYEIEHLSKPAKK